MACAAPVIVYGLAGLRGLVIAGGLIMVVVLLRSWWRGRRLAGARTLERVYALTPGEFEVLNQRLFQRIGYALQRVGGTGDGGIDLAGVSAEGGILVQCKRYRGSVGAAQVRDFYGALSKARAARGYLVTTGSFTAAAREWIEDLPIPLELVDGTALAGLLRTYLAPDVIPYLEGTAARLALVAALLAITFLAAALTPGPDPDALAFLNPLFP